MIYQLFSGSCKIARDIPKWISNQKNLHFLELSDNQLTGRFPIWLAEMKVGSILLSDNMLTSSIPSRLFSLQVYHLSRNNFSGELLENIGDANETKLVMLSGNNFSGSIPKSIADIYRLCCWTCQETDSLVTHFQFSILMVYLFMLIFPLMNYQVTFAVSFCRETKFLALGKNKFFGNLTRNLT